ncbi:hypothetical protein F442_11004 [Phytophthora nicotianae P10297]|uniref:Uncharacterized protein n=1 Tax=Phytophthora nicotianae P10297 TaxID=1317064 RepID=W2Z4Z3_PHYNI|nr:hypothetical protein F442_11004 [Phytophthora nicotianae P10297]
MPSIFVRVKGRMRPSKIHRMPLYDDIDFESHNRCVTVAWLRRWLQRRESTMWGQEQCGGHFESNSGPLWSRKLVGYIPNANVWRLLLEAVFVLYWLSAIKQLGDGMPFQFSSPFRGAANVSQTFLFSAFLVLLRLFFL